MKSIVIKVWIALEFNPQSESLVSLTAWADSAYGALEKGILLAKSESSIIKSFCLKEGTEKIEDWFMNQGLSIFKAHKLVHLVKSEVFSKLEILNVPTSKTQGG